MIAKSFLSMLFTLVTWTALSQSISTKEFQYYYQVAYDYDIHPPELEYGYPWWFDADSLPVSGIIFLKEDLLAPLEKLNDTAWVARPTSDNAKEIAAFIMPEHLGYMPKYLIVPDSGLTYQIIQVFMDSLLCELEYGIIEYFSFEGKYSRIKYNHQKPNDFWFCGDGIWGDRLEIFVNKNFEFLIEGKLSIIDSIKSAVLHSYIKNLDEIKNRNSWTYTNFSRKLMDSKIAQFHELLNRYPEDEIIKQEYLKFKSFKNDIERYGSLKILDKYAMIIFKAIGENLTISRIYSVFSQINEGLYLSRLSLDSSYSNLYSLRQFDRLRYIHTQIPDLIYDFEESNWMPAPVAPKPLQPDPQKRPIPEDSKGY
jgi:hypothetical protein